MTISAEELERDKKKAELDAAYTYPPLRFGVPAAKLLLKYIAEVEALRQTVERLQAENERQRESMKRSARRIEQRATGHKNTPDMLPELVDKSEHAAILREEPWIGSHQLAWAIEEINELRAQGKAKDSETFRLKELLRLTLPALSTAYPNSGGLPSAGSLAEAIEKELV